MSHWIGIHIEEIRPAADTIVAWGLFDEHCNPLAGGSCPLARVRAQAGAAAEKLEVRVFVSGVGVMLTEVNIPSRQASHMRKALPFMVEDQLIGDLRQTHLAVGPVQFGDSVPVAVVAHAQMIAWLEALHSAGLSPTAMVPDQLALPREPGSIFVQISGDRALVRFGDCRGVVVRPDNLVLILDMALQQRAMPCSRIEIAACATSAADMERADALGNEIGERLDRPIRRTNFRESLVEVLAASLRGQHQAFNLCQGGYRVDRKGGATSSWGIAWAAAAACVVVFMIACYAGGAVMNRRAADVHAEAITVFRELFPDERRVVNLRRQAESRLAMAGASGGSGPLGSIATLARALGDASVAGTAVQTLRYQGEGGVLHAEVTAPALARINRLEEVLGNSGAAAKLLGASEDAGVASGRLELRTQ